MHNTIKSDAPNRTFRSILWSIELPNGWTSFREPECVSFRNHPPLGVLQISAASKGDGPITLKELQDFVLEPNHPQRNLQAIHAATHSGVFAEYIKDGFFWREWWLMSGATMVYLTYNVQAGQQSFEIAEVERIVESLVFCDSGTSEGSLMKQ